MRTSAMTGHTGDRWNCISFVVFVEGKVFLVDPTGHLVHVTGDVFLRLGVTGKIELVDRAVRKRSMTEITFYAECGFPTVHYLFQLVVCNVPGQHFEVVFRLRVVLGADCCHAYDHEAKQGGDDNDFLKMQHGKNLSY